MNTRSARSSNLAFYQWFERLGWPRSYLGKVFTIAFIATHVPLLCFLIYFFFDFKNVTKGIIFLLLLLATLVGTTLFFWTWQQMLEPMLLAKQALGGYLARGQVIELPTSFSDEVGLLLNFTVAGAEIQLTVSIGFTLARGAEQPSVCLERAELALLRAKYAGWNRVEFCQP